MTKSPIFSDAVRLVIEVQVCIIPFCIVMVIRYFKKHSNKLNEMSKQDLRCKKKGGGFCGFVFVVLLFFLSIKKEETQICVESRES